MSKNRHVCAIRTGAIDPAGYAAVDRAWRAIGLAAPARRALIDAGMRELPDLARITEPDLAALHGMGPSAMETLRQAMFAAGIAFAPV